VVVGSGCEKASGRGGGISLDLSDIKWEMGLRSGFGIICGVRTNP